MAQDIEITFPEFSNMLVETEVTEELEDKKIIEGN